MTNRFGSTHTQTKLDVLSNYLESYTTALKNRNFLTTYFDAFAGSGDIQINDPESTLESRLPHFPEIQDKTGLIEGSAVRALRTRTPFDRYCFVEHTESQIETLRARLGAQPRIERCTFICADANDAIVRFCQSQDWKGARAVVFLDPYGSQVRWETIEIIAKTKAVDLWYLFPAGLSVARQISRRGTVHQSHEAALTRLFGGDHWHDELIRKENQPGLFGETTETIKDCDPAKATELMIKQMKAVFAGTVLDDWLPLGRNGSHWYSLIFATSNPSPKAIALARKLGSAVLKVR